MKNFTAGVSGAKAIVARNRTAADTRLAFCPILTAVADGYGFLVAKWPCMDHEMERSLLDIGALDRQIQKELARYGMAKEFRIVLWRQETDAEGSNWNARIERTNGGALDTFTWWDVIPQMRERFNLK